MSSCMSQLSQKAKTNLETKLTNNIEVSDDIQAIDGVVKVQWETGSMMTVMLHSFMHPTAQHSAQTWCTASIL